MDKVKLSSIPLEEDQVIVEGFKAELDGQPVVITAVLERTCVYETDSFERRVVNKSRLLVDRDALPIRRRRMMSSGGGIELKRRTGPRPASS